MSEILSLISFTAYNMMLTFDSGSTVTAFSHIRFLNRGRDELGAFDIAAVELIQAPVRRFVGQILTNIKESDGKVELEFGVAGSICVERVGGEPEVALLIFDG